MTRLARINDIFNDHDDVNDYEIPENPMRYFAIEVDFEGDCLWAHNRLTLDELAESVNSSETTGVCEVIAFDLDDELVEIETHRTIRFVQK